MSTLPPLDCTTRPTRSGHRIAVTTLQREAALNALSLPMIQALDAALIAWMADPDVVAVVLRGAGRAFCAGGDVRALHQSMVSHDGPGVPPEAAAFFEGEYRLDYRIHRATKPILCWGHGVVMGGGIGLMAGASHRVVTDTTRLAMPEITIGLYPDVGASWFLPRMPGQVGRFLALSGARFDANDALAIGLADYRIDVARGPEVLAALDAAEWTGHPTQDGDVLSRLLDAHAGAPGPSRLQEQAARIAALIGAPDPLPMVVARLTALATDPDPWWAEVGRLVQGGSPTSLALIEALWHRAEGRSLAEVFRLEYALSLGCTLHPDFREGVRALLIDRGQSPQWTPPTLEQVSSTWVAEHFVPVPPATHPLSDLV